PTLDYAGIIAVQHAELGPRDLPGLQRYWRRRLEGWQPLRFPRDREPVGRCLHRAVAHLFRLDERMRSALVNLVREVRASLPVVLFGAWQALLAARCGQEDLLVQGVVANRWKRAHDDLVGLFANMLPRRTQIPTGTSFRTLLVNLRAQAVE